VLRPFRVGIRVDGGDAVRAAVKAVNVLSAAAKQNARLEKRYSDGFDRLATRPRAQFRRRVAPRTYSRSILAAPARSPQPAPGPRSLRKTVFLGSLASC
jgi:hypothetical protein